MSHKYQERVRNEKENVGVITEWLTGEHKHFDFTTSMNLDVYNGHIDSLDKIESTWRGFYHRMMADIYHLAL
jgi:hypothetical protein